jgi:3-hydroxyisobutyrate dehydrogenase-like beta-hydroxyacid dehydrogenase
MCLNLIQKGLLDKPLLVYNRTKKRSEDFVAQFRPEQAVASDSLEESVSPADIIFTCLSNDAAVFETYESIANGGNTKGKLFVDCSTVHPDSTDKVGKMMVDSGAGFVSSPGKSVH